MTVINEKERCIGMNVIWSQYIQGIKTLYYSRKLRFDDMFSEQYKNLFELDSSKNIKILEIGCGPGALAEALHRWYPQADITAIDRDSEFIRFAKENEKDVTFLEADAVNLPFEDNTFDVTISNTVSEHIEPSKFYGEQFRVLKPGGICLVLSSRKGINIAPSCMALNDFEKQFWEKVSQHDDSMSRYSVCKYPMSEAELPLTMETYGFQNIKTGFATIDLTPDHPKFSSDMAYNMIHANRYMSIDAIEATLHTMPDLVTIEETEEMKHFANAKYDMRIEQYDRGEKQWDTNVSVIMVVRGIK